MRDYDGVVFSGGKDINPKHYEEALKYPGLVEVDEKRDTFEFELFDRAHRCRVPILGICRGVQMINVKFGGTLYQDLKQEFSPDTCGEARTQSVRAAPGGNPRRHADRPGFRSCGNVSRQLPGQ